LGLKGFVDVDVDVVEMHFQSLWIYVTHSYKLMGLQCILLFLKYILDVLNISSLPVS